MSAPFASIIVPTYNQASYIGNALDSLLGQTDPSWEAIVVNDGSTDDTPRILDDYAARDARFKIIHKANGGVASALNEGLERATGEWVHWLSSDDMFEPEKLAINRRWIARHPDARFFFSYFTLLRDATGECEKRDLWGPVPDPDHQILTLFYRNYISGISICVHRESWKTVGLFDERYYYAQDYDQWLRILKKHRGVFIPEWTVINRNHASQGSEIFPDACYFDTTKAAIDFINRHRFPELVPGVDLANQERALAAVSAAMSVAADDSAFLYALGPTPALVLRVLEWVFGRDIADPALALRLREHVRGHIVEQALRPRVGAIRWMWQALAAAVTQPEPSFIYDPTDHLKLARLRHAALLVENPKRAEALRRYLLRFDHITMDAGEGGAGEPARVVVHAPRVSGTARRGLLQAAEDLLLRGHHPVLVLDQQESFRWHSGSATVACGSQEVDTLPWFHDASVSVAVDTPASAWLDAHIRLDLPAGDSEKLPDLVDCALQRYRQPSPPGTIRTVAFLQRVLRGGGAERVVRDIANHLDRRRYRPFVLTLFDGPVDASYAADIPVLNVRQFLHDTLNAHDPSPPPTPVTTEAEPVLATEMPSPPLTDGAGAPTGETGVVHWLRMRLQQYPRARAAIRKVRTVPEGLRSSLHAGRDHYEQRMLDLLRRLGRRILARHRSVPLTGAEMVVETSVAPRSLAAQMFSTRHATFLKSLDSHWPAGDGLRILMSNLGPEAALISVMEEATVAAWLAQQGGGIRFIASLHTVESQYLPMMYPDPVRYVTEEWAFGNACRSAEWVVFPTAGCGQDLMSFASVDAARVRTIANPVSCAHIRRLSFAASEHQFRRPGETLFVHLGRIDVTKGHDLLVQAFAQYRIETPACRLVCIGDGPEFATLERQIAELGLADCVHLVGAIDNPFPILRQADALVLSSRFESFALVLVEGMVCGVPVVSVDCPYGPSDILDGGKFGILVPPDNPSALAEGMKRAATDPEMRGDLIQGGYQRALDYDVERVTREWERMIDSTFASSNIAS